MISRSNVWVVVANTGSTYYDPTSPVVGVFTTPQAARRAARYYDKHAGLTDDPEMGAAVRRVPLDAMVPVTWVADREEGGEPTLTLYVPRVPIGRYDDDTDPRYIAADGYTPEQALARLKHLERRARRG